MRFLTVQPQIDLTERVPMNDGLKLAKHYLLFYRNTPILDKAKDKS